MSTDIRESCWTLILTSIATAEQNILTLKAKCQPGNNNVTFCVVVGSPAPSTHQPITEPVVFRHPQITNI